MMKLKGILWVMLLFIFIFHGCKQQKPVFQKNDFRLALRTFIQDKAFVGTTGFDFKNKKAFLVYTDYNLVDTMYIMNQTFYINFDPKNENFKGDQVIRVNVSSPSVLSSKIMVDYAPSPKFSITYELDGKYKNDIWKFSVKNSLISDKVQIVPSGEGTIIDKEFMRTH